MPTIWANPFACSWWRILSIVIVLDSFFPSNHLFENRMLLTTLSQFLTFCSAPLSSAVNYGLLSDTILSSNLCNFHILFLNSVVNPSIVATKCIILDNLSQTTKIAFFPVTNSKFVIKSTIKYIHSFSVPHLILTFLLIFLFFFYSLIHITFFYILSHISCYSWPPVISHYQLHCFPFFSMSCY